ncbi:MAG: hypothetical protein ACT4P5_19180 [Armatimonadota bacterium]
MSAGTPQDSSRTAGGVAGLVEGAGAGLILIGAYVPWVVSFALFTSVPVRGVETPFGRVLPLIPLVALGLLAWRWYARKARWVHLPIMALGIATVALAIAYAVQVNRNLARTQQSLARSGQVLPGTVRVNFDVGIFLSAAGGAAMVIGGILGVRQDGAVPREGMNA